MARFTRRPARNAARPAVEQGSDARRRWRGTNPRSLGLPTIGVALLLVLAVSRREDVGATAAVLAQLAPLPFLIAVGLSVVGMVNRAGQFRSAHRLAGIEADLRSMVRVSAAGYALNKLVKTGGLGGVALFVRHGRQRGRPAGAVLAACLVSSLSGLVALVAVAGLVVASTAVDVPTTGSLIGAVAGVALLVVFGLPVAGAVCLRSRALVERWHPLPFRAIRRLTARFGRRGPTVPDPVHVDRFYAAIATLRADPMASAPVLAHAMVAKFIGAAVLLAALAAVGADIGLEAVLVVYVMALAAAAISIRPGGLGAVEATMTLLLDGYGVPPATALAGTVAFRFLDLWVPVLVGLVAAPGLEGSTERSARPEPVDVELFDLAVGSASR